MPTLLLTAALSMVGVLIGAALQYVFGRTLESKKQIQTQKAQAYSDYFKATAALAQASSKDGLAQAADAKTRISLYGSATVVHSLAEFERAGPRLDNPVSKAALLKALQSMRTDVGAGRSAAASSDLEAIIFGPPGQIRR